ncbi:MAG: hypothetical protein ACXW0Z_12340 [Gemmatirosa sp.]
MRTTARATERATWTDWRIPALLVLLSLVPAVMGTARLAELAAGGAVTPENARFYA